MSYCPFEPLGLNFHHLFLLGSLYWSLWKICTEELFGLHMEIPFPCAAHGKLSQEFHVHIHWIISMCRWTWNSIVHQPVISNGPSVFLGSCKLAANHNLASDCQTTGTHHNLANTSLVWHPMEKILVTLRHCTRGSLIMHHNHNCRITTKHP